MRCVFWTCLFAILLVASSGCLQPAPVNTPPAETAVYITTVPITPVTPHPEKYVNFTASQSQTLVNITYNGGPDAADLQSVAILITNHDGTQVERTIMNPTIGATYSFTYRGTANAARVNIIGTFQDGYQQTVLIETV
jgi:hypothetical protein